MLTIRQLILRGEWEVAEDLRATEPAHDVPPHGLLWTAVSKNRAFGDLLPGIGDSFANMLLNSPKQYESVVQVANRNTEFLDSPAMAGCLESSDFQLAS